MTPGDKPVTPSPQKSTVRSPDVPECYLSAFAHDVPSVWNSSGNPNNLPSEPLSSLNPSPLWRSFFNTMAVPGHFPIFVYCNELTLSVCILGLLDHSVSTWKMRYRARTLRFFVSLTPRTELGPQQVLRKHLALKGMYVACLSSNKISIPPKM